MKPPIPGQLASAAATSSPKPLTLEKVARAIERRLIEMDMRDNGATPPPGWKIPDEAPGPDAYAIARAALQSLRQVDDETVEAMFKRWRSGPDHTVRGAQRSCFVAAIDSILGETGRAEVTHGG